MEVDKLFNERKALEEYIQFITKHIESMYENYYEAIKRIAELDEIERGRDKQDVVESESMSWQDAVHAHQAQQLPVATTTQTKLEREGHLQRTKPEKLRQNRDLSKVANKLCQILREEGQPMKLSKLFQTYYEQTGDKVQKHGSRMPQIMEHAPKIERVARGYYQYRR